MPAQRITVRVGRDGQITAETQGIKGKACLPYIALLENMLEAETVDSDYTSDFYDAASITQVSQNKDLTTGG